MSPLIRRFWPLLAVAAGVLLIYFEYHHSHGITADNAFWLFVAVLIIILALIDLFQKRDDSKKR